MYTCFQSKKNNVFVVIFGDKHTCLYFNDNCSCCLNPGRGKKVFSYANRFKENIERYPKLKINVLDIFSEKKSVREYITLMGYQLAEVCQKIWVNVESETEG